MNSPSNNSPGLVLRSLSIVTEIITHPYVAWFLFVMLGLYNGLVGWGMQQFLEANATTQSVRLEFDHHLLESQKEILEKLEKALAESGNSQ